MQYIFCKSARQHASEQRRFTAKLRHVRKRRKQADEGKGNGPLKNVRMRMARIERGLSQQELADCVGATRQTIGLIEAGDYNPSLKLCTAICKTLGKTLDDLFWFEGDDHESC